MKLPDSVFEGVLRELPIDATNVEVVVTYSYSIPSLGTHKASTTRFFPTKAEATFKRETAKVKDAMKTLGEDIDKALGLMKGLEDRTHKRLNKLERKNDSDTTGDS